MVILSYNLLSHIHILGTKALSLIHNFSPAPVFYGSGGFLTSYSISTYKKVQIILIFLLTSSSPSRKIADNEIKDLLCDTETSQKRVTAQRDFSSLLGVAISLLGFLFLRCENEMFHYSSGRVITCSCWRRRKPSGSR
jgi:hypothetical protein